MRRTDPKDGKATLHKSTAVVPHNRLTFGAAEADAVRAVVASGQWAGGAQVAALEAELADMAGVAHAVAVASGSAALRLALAAVGVGPGDAVSVPAYSCVALANAALSLGAQVEPSDVEHGTWNVSSPVASAGTSTRATIVVNTFGLPVDIPAHESSRAAVIEDCAHGFGVTHAGRRLGGRTRASVISFYATKLVGGGEGGAVMTNSSDIADFVRTWRDYDERPPHPLAHNYRMNDLEAALAREQLGRLPDLIRRRQDRAERYHALLGDHVGQHGLSLPVWADERVWYRYAVTSDLSVDVLIQRMSEHGVDVANPITDWRPPDATGSAAAFAYRRVVSLPLYPTLEPEEQDRVVSALLDSLR